MSRPRQSIQTILLVEDSAGDARLLREMLRDHGYTDGNLSHVTCMGAAEDHLATRGVDIILLDLGLPDAQGLDAVRRAHAAAPRVPLVVLTGLDDESLAVQALHEGAQDYLVKGQIEARGLMRAMCYAIERCQIEDALVVEKDRAQVTLDCIGDAVICTDAPGNITFLNVVAETMTGWSRTEAMGHSLAEVFRLRNDAAPAPTMTARRLTRSVHLRRDGVERSVEESFAPIYDRDGRWTGSVTVFREVGAACATS